MLQWVMDNWVVNIVCPLVVLGISGSIPYIYKRIKSHIPVKSKASDLELILYGTNNSSIGRLVINNPLLEKRPIIIHCTYSYDGKIKKSKKTLNCKAHNETTIKITDLIPQQYVQYSKVKVEDIYLFDCINKINVPPTNPDVKSDMKNF